MPHISPPACRQWAAVITTLELIREPPHIISVDSFLRFSYTRATIQGNSWSPAWLPRAITGLVALPQFSFNSFFWVNVTNQYSINSGTLERSVTKKGVDKIVLQMFSHNNYRDSYWLDWFSVNWGHSVLLFPKKIVVPVLYTASCSIRPIWEYEFYSLDCWEVLKGKLWKFC